MHIHLFSNFIKMLFRRFLCSHTVAGHRNRNQWTVKQVTKSNYSEALDEFKDCLANSDFIAVSLQKTGGYAAPWQKILPIDTAETAYIKAKRRAERFQILQFSACPFSVKASKLTAHPYNFQLFPRDELKVGMPSYSFSCQSSYLTSMAREGFDFNACIYNGISYLSRAQESAVTGQNARLLLNSSTAQSSLTYSVADTIFTERIRTRVKNWVNVCTDANKPEVEDILLSSLRKVISKMEVYGSRPSLTIDVCSERQVQLASEVLKDFVNVVPLQVVRNFGVHAIRVVLASSEEDKNLIMKEIQDKEKEQRRIVCGFREVVDLISTSQRPIVVHNTLNDFAFMHSKFLAPLPPTVDEFTNSLFSLFPHIIDINNLMKEIGLLDKMHNLPAAISYLDARFPAPVFIETPDREFDKVNIHGHNVLRMCQLFVKLCSVLKISIDVPKSDHAQLSSSLQRFSNTFGPCLTNFMGPANDNVRIWTGNSRTVSTDNLVFLWGFQSGMSAQNLKNLLSDSHDVFCQEFDVKMVDRTCAIVVFWTSGFGDRFLRTMDSGDICFDKLKDMISEGLKAAGYATYKRVCESGLWKPDLAECLEQAMDETEMLSGAISLQEQSVICWNNDEMINLDEL